MKFRDEFSQYLEGCLDQVKKAEVEADIEKVQVITDYLNERTDAQFFADETSSTDDLIANEQKKMTEMINRAVNRKLIKYNLIVGGAILVIVLFLMFGLSPLMDAMYYNPMKPTDSKDYQIPAVNMPLAVFTEMHLGNKGYYDLSFIKSEGYGRYDLNIRTQLNGKINEKSMTIDKNKIVGSNQYLNSSDMPMNAFSYFEGLDACVSASEGSDYLSSLPDSAIVKACVSFNQVIGLERLTEFMEQNKSGYLYVPILDNNTKYWRSSYYVGFSPLLSGPVLTNYYDKKVFPYLDLVQYFDDNSFETKISACIYEQHFISMLQFMSEQSEFNVIFENSFDYQYTLDFVKMNGVQTYGVVVFSTKNELEQILNDELVDGLYVLDVEVSSYSR